MATFVRRNGKVIPKEEAGEYRIPWTTGIISDSMQPLKHMATGRTIDSKSLFRKETRASGCVETGDQTPKPRQPITLDRGQRREAIRKAIYHARNG